MTKWRQASMLGGIVDGYRYEFRDDGTDVVFFSGEAYRPTGKKTKQGDEIWRYDPTLTQANEQAVNLVPAGTQTDDLERPPRVEIGQNKDDNMWELRVEGEVLDKRKNGPANRKEAQAWLGEVLGMSVVHVQHDQEG